MTEPAQPEKPKRKKRTLILLVVALVIVLGATTVYLLGRGKESTDDATIETDIISIAPKVSGYVHIVNVRDNQLVKAGNVLVEIDPVDYKIALVSAQAKLAAAQAKVGSSQETYESTKVSAPSNISSAQAEVASAQANYDKAAADLNRYQSMNPLALSKQQLDVAVAAEKSAKADLEGARAKLRSAQTAPKAIASAEANVKQLAAEVAAAQAEVAQAEENLKNTQIIAPVDGRVTKKGIEPGVFVQPGQQLLSLVSNDYWVVANFKETQLEHMRIGQPVDIKIDAYPGKTYRGQIDSMQSGTGSHFSAFPAENATGNFVKIVQRVPVKILFTERPDATLAVGPGMSVEPVVITK